MMIITVDIDQFICITCITSFPIRFNQMGGILCLENVLFVPLELFNMDIRYWFITNFPASSVLEKMVRINPNRRKNFRNFVADSFTSTRLNILLQRYLNNQHMLI